MATEKVILVDEHDRQTGVMEKMAAHVEGKLHRAISVFIFNSRNELLLQQRAEGKYHSPALWTNTCCSHPRPGEDAGVAATRRLDEEMGMTVPLEKVFCFLYRANVGGGLTEFEYDHVFAGVADTAPTPDPDEVQNWKSISHDSLLKSIDESPDLYTEWFKIFIRECGHELFFNRSAKVDGSRLFTSIQD